MREYIKDIDQYNLYKKHYSKGFPFDVIAFAKDLGINVTQSNFNSNDKVSGLIKKFSENNIVISVKANDVDTRQRFTIAHELGHFFLHQDLLEEGFMDGVGLMRDGSNNEIEKQANSFAANLLMPEAIFREMWSNNKLSSKQIANFFYVSESAVIIRAINLKLTDDYSSYFG